MLAAPNLGAPSAAFHSNPGPERIPVVELVV
jgi:hypothetical protein